MATSMDEEEKSGKSGGGDQRAHKRFSYVGKAYVRPPGGFAEEHGAILDLSLGGCLLRLENPLDLLVGSEIEINLQSSYLSCRALGTIRRFREAKHVVGCSFEHLTSHGRSDLQNLINDLESGELEPMPQPMTIAY